MRLQLRRRANDHIPYATALVLARLPTLASRLAYIGLFGLGSVLGMGLLSGVASASLSGLEARSRCNARLLGSTGALSLLLGAFWGWRSVRLLHW